MAKKNQRNKRRIEELVPLLAFDTSTDFLVMAVAVDEERRFGYSKVAARTHQEEFVDALDSLLKISKLKIENVRAIAVGVGPGSYTGVRVGVTAGRTFAHAMGVPLVPVDSLMMQAASIFLEICEKDYDLRMAKIAIVNDAKRNEYYYAIYSVEKSNKHLEMACLKNPAVSGLNEIKKILNEQSTPLFFVGSDFEIELGRKSLRVKPRFEGLLECALKNLMEGIFPRWWEVLPVYLRASYAEENLKNESTGKS